MTFLQWLGAVALIAVASVVIGLVAYWFGHRHG